MAKSNTWKEAAPWIAAGALALLGGGFAYVISEEANRRRQEYERELYECPVCQAGLAYGESPCWNCGTHLTWREHTGA